MSINGEYEDAIKCVRIFDGIPSCTAWWITFMIIIEKFIIIIEKLSCFESYLNVVSLGKF